MSINASKNVKQRLLGLADSQTEVRNRDVAALLGISRQAAHQHLRALVDSGDLEQVGSGRGARYQRTRRIYQAKYKTKALEEDKVWQDLKGKFEPLFTLRGNAETVFRYAVTELVNNAIEHSKSRNVTVAMEAKGNVLSLEVVDEGIGIFEHVRHYFDLESPLEGLQELSKGKVTTDPARHTGEGIFFVSKAATLFVIRSRALEWQIDNARNDMAVRKMEKPFAGTCIRFEVNLERVTELRELFDRYTEDYEFVRTRMVVRLFTINTTFVSRSEAKRLLHALEKFREIVLDFHGVEWIGQGFADEVFRVWKRDHPKVKLAPINMAETVAFMVKRSCQKPAVD